MATFPSHPIELHKMFKSTGLSVMNPEIENGLFMIKIHKSKVKSVKDLNDAFSKVQETAKNNGFDIILNRVNYQISDFKFHGSYFIIYFNA